MSRVHTPPHLAPVRKVLSGSMFFSASSRERLNNASTMGCSEWYAGLDEMSRLSFQVLAAVSAAFRGFSFTVRV